MKFILLQLHEFLVFTTKIWNYFFKMFKLLRLLPGNARAPVDFLVTRPFFCCCLSSLAPTRFDQVVVLSLFCPRTSFSSSLFSPLFLLVPLTGFWTSPFLLLKTLVGVLTSSLDLMSFTSWDSWLVLSATFLSIILNFVLRASHLASTCSSLELGPCVTTPLL